MPGGKNFNYIPTISLIILTICVCLFILLYEKQAADKAQHNLDRHALIIADGLWNFNVDGVAEYLKLAATADNYEYLEVVNHNGELFHKVKGNLSRAEQYALRFKLIPRVVLVAPVESRTNVIGWIETVWIPHTLGFQLIALVIAGLVQLVITLYCRILASKAELEKSVIARTIELTEANEYLIREIRERTQAEKERQNLQRRLEQSKKMETLGVLAGGVAHDLNNVLSGIVSYPDLVLRELPETSSLRKPIELIRSSGIRAAEIVQDLLTLARRGIVTKAPLDLNKIVEEYLNSPEHKKLLDFHPGIDISLRFTQKGGIVMGSAVALKKVLMNLVANAAEAMPQGGEIKISTKRIQLQTPLEGFQNIGPGDWLIFSVCDQGDGISDEDLARIFEPFYTRKVMGRSGSGLGLTVVWGTVQDHGGAIDIHRRAPQGTTIDIFLPAEANMQIEPLTSEQAADFSTGQGETILVIDDAEHQREIATAILKKLGYSPAAVASGEEALAWLRQNHASLLILDMIMEGGMDGMETYRQILDIHPGQKAIIVSGYSETERVRQAQALGAGQYLRKPYQYSQLAEAVWKELHRNP